jgi:PHS family inorganic phosphate transporter-like MFS transporter
MLGMLVFGKIADAAGSRFAGILAAFFQIVGVVVMTFYMNEDVGTLFLVWAIFFGIFGFGIGGEYPLTAAGAAAHHVKSMEEADLDDAEQHRIRVLREKERTARRGETIAIVFAMQGVGAVVGSLFVCILLYFGQQEYHDWLVIRCCCFVFLSYILMLCFIAFHWNVILIHSEDEGNK